MSFTLVSATNKTHKTIENTVFQVGPRDKIRLSFSKEIEENTLSAYVYFTRVVKFPFSNELAELATRESWGVQVAGDHDAAVALKVVANCNTCDLEPANWHHYLLPAV